MMTRMTKLAGALAALGASLVATARGDDAAAPAPVTAPAEPQDGRAERAFAATLELDYPTAHRLLDDADASDPSVAIERARLALYQGDCDGAAATLARADLAKSDRAAELASVAGGCARATAATLVVTDEARGVVVRLQDEDDAPLVPLLAEVAASAREMLTRDLGVELPRPLRIELVRDLLALSAITGLPEEAAQTTGTVAVAKWGRVTMISPRAMPQGYAWADTLVHEMTHLAQTRASRDRAPLWLQEGVAKSHETRWRAARPFDDDPPADAVALSGIRLGLARPIDAIGASVALLPSAEHAQVVFAEVTSFVRFWSRTAGDHALPELLHGLRAASVDDAMTAASGATLADWKQRWEKWVESAPPLREDEALRAVPPHHAEVRRQAQLAELLTARGHDASAAKLLAKAYALAPRDPWVRERLAWARIASGHEEEAAPLVEKVEDVRSESGLWYALHGRYLRAAGDAAAADDAFRTAIRLDPLDPRIACETLDAPDAPADPARGALCRAARAAGRR